MAQKKKQVRRSKTAAKVAKATPSKKPRQEHGMTAWQASNAMKLTQDICDHLARQVDHLVAQVDGMRRDQEASLMTLRNDQSVVRTLIDQVRADLASRTQLIEQLSQFQARAHAAEVAMHKAGVGNLSDAGASTQDDASMGPLERAMMSEARKEGDDLGGVFTDE